MLSEGRVQTTDLLGAEGQSGPLRLDKSMAAAIMQALPRYTDQVRRGNSYYAANTAAGALSVNSTTATGLILYNPAGSGVGLVLTGLSVAIQSLPAGAAGLVLTGGAQAAVPGTTTLITGGINGIQSCYPGKFTAATSKALAYSIATIATAAIMRWIGGGPAATVATGTAFPPFIRDVIDGDLIIGPGQVVSVQAVTTAMTVGSSISWVEVPLA